MRTTRCLEHTTEGDIYSGSISATCANINRRLEALPNMIEWLIKFVIGLHLPGSKKATGSPHVDGVGLPSVRSCGTAAR